MLNVNDRKKIAEAIMGGVSTGLGLTFTLIACSLVEYTDFDLFPCVAICGLSVLMMIAGLLQLNAFEEGE